MLKVSSKVLRLCVATNVRHECSRCTLKAVVSQSARPKAVWRAVFCRACFVVRLHMACFASECLHALRRKILERKIYRRTHKFNKICDVAANKFKTKFRTACGTSAFYGEVAYCKMRCVLRCPGAENRSACERVCNDVAA